MRTSFSKTLIASLAALTMGVALSGSVGSAFADPSNSHNTYNPLNPYAATNSAYIGSFSANISGTVGSMEESAPIAPTGQSEVNCHLRDNYKRPFC